MQSFFLTYKSSQIHYQLTGRGKRPLVAFHGYSDSAGSFDLLEEYIGDEFTLLAIDLPFHGKTNWKEGLTFTPSDLFEIIDTIANDFSQPHSKIYLLGFSMGGRIALSLFQYMPGRVEKLILLASDGLLISKWYWLATQTSFGNALFNFTAKHPGWFFGIMHAGKKTNLIKQSVYKFSLSHMNEKKLRDDLYARWMTMRKFTTNFKKLKSLVHSNKTAVRLIYGEYDHIIQTNGGEKFMKGIEPYCQLIILPCGHHVLQEKNLEAIVRLIRE